MLRSRSGGALTAETVARLAGVPLDGVLVANFAAVRKLVDAVDGVNVCLPYTVKSSDTGVTWPAGCHDLDGKAADDLMRQRHGCPAATSGASTTNSWWSGPSPNASAPRACSPSRPGSTRC
ncbi:hypothetical protein GCM10027614_04630 [Micromonospora vulcania]